MGILAFIGLNLVILLWPFLTLAAVWFGSADEQWLIRAASPFVLPFTAAFWYIVPRAFVLMRRQP